MDTKENLPFSTYFSLVNFFQSDFYSITQPCPNTNAELLQEGILFLIHLFARVVLVMNK